jgi:metal-sulfur cluster biosynthetic enzyme
VNGKVLPRNAAQSPHAAVWTALNQIIDPCSVAMAEPLGIGDMGLVEEIAVTGGHVEVALLPTSPHCLYVGLLEQAIEATLASMQWVDSVTVRLTDADRIWDESRMTAAARDRLTHRRAAARASLKAREDQRR